MRLTIRAALAAVAGGAAGALAHPPVAAWPLAFAAVPLLLWALLLDRDGGGGAGRAAALGALFGAALYGPMLVWIVAPAGVVGWVLLVAVQAGFVAAAVLVVRPWIGSVWLVAVTPVVWTGMDAIRGGVPFGGFGWGALGYTQVDSWLLPLARLGGARAVTLIVVLFGVLAFEAVRRAAAPAHRVAPTGRVAAAAPLLAGLAAAVALTVAVRVAPPAPSDRRVDVLVVQGNDLEEWDGSARALDLAIARNQVALTAQAVADGGRADLTVWPESSVDRDPFRAGNEDLRALLEEGAALAGGDLLAGAILDGSRPGTFRNVALLAGADGTVEDRYVKRRLVPFGEYVPLRSVLGDLPPLRQIPRDGVPERRPQALPSAPGRVAVVICFETLFAELVRSNVRTGDAGIIVATTNDASFGRGAEPAQHLAQSRMRAVETGRHVVHAALSGSSAFVAPDGTVTQRTALFRRATPRAQVPVVEGATPFLTAGDVVGKGAGWGVAVLALLGVVRHTRRRRPAGEDGA